MNSISCIVSMLYVSMSLTETQTISTSLFMLNVANLMLSQRFLMQFKKYRIELSYITKEHKIL